MKKNIYKNLTLVYTYVKLIIHGKGPQRMKYSPVFISRYLGKVRPLVYCVVFCIVYLYSAVYLLDPLCNQSQLQKYTLSFEATEIPITD